LDRLEHLGAAIPIALPSIVEYEDDEQRDIFDDGLSDDESSDSDISTNYEDLEEPDLITLVQFVPELDPNHSEDELDSDASRASNEPDDVYDSNSDATSDGTASQNEVTANDSEQSATVQGPAHYTVVPGPTEIHPLPPANFAELLKERYDVLYHNSISYNESGDYPGKWHYHRPIVSMEEDCDILRWKLLALEEMKKWVDSGIAEIQIEMEAAQKRKQDAEDKVSASLERAGIPQSLYEAYELFCESLNPEFGQRGGFSVTCNQRHNGSYVEYDPEFALFRDCVEMPYTHCNFRCEASTLGKDKEPKEYVVEFWPIKSPEPITGEESTWGDQYVSLISNFCEARTNMLISRPAHVV